MGAVAAGPPSAGEDSQGQMVGLGRQALAVGLAAEHGQAPPPFTVVTTNSGDCTQVAMAFPSRPTRTRGCGC